MSLLRLYKKCFIIISITILAVCNALCAMDTTQSLKLKLKKAIEEKDLNLIEDLIVNQNVPFDIEDMNKHNILIKSIDEKRILLIKKLMIPGVAKVHLLFPADICDKIGVRPNYTSVTYSIFCEKFPHDTHNFLNELIQCGGLTQEIDTFMNISSLSFALKKLNYNHRDHEDTTFLQSCIVTMLESGFDDAKIDCIGRFDWKEMIANQEDLKDLYKKLEYAEILHGSIDQAHEQYNVIEKCFNENNISFAFKIALSIQEPEFLWMMNAIAHEKKYTYHDLNKLFTKPDYPHYCTHECKLFLPMFNFLRTLNDLKTNQISGDMRFVFE